MEAWVTVAVALIVALSTLGATYFQNRHSSKRFEKELEKAREDAQHQRRWVVRSVPLVRLRDELARVTSNLRMLVIDTRDLHYRSNITDEEKNQKLERAAGELKVYLGDKDCLQALNLQYDKELFMKGWEILSDYSILFEYASRQGNLKAGEETYSIKLAEDIMNNILKVQELIYKRLEEL